MKGLSGKILVIKSILLIILLVSCALQKKEAFDQIIMQSQQQLIGGNYQKALDYYIAACEEYPDDKILLENYIMTVNKVKQNGDIALEEENFVLAEKIYSVLLKNYPHFAKLNGSLSFTKNSLGNKLRITKINMSERQSRQYLEAGEFEKAMNSCVASYQIYPNDPVLLTNLINIILDMKFLAKIAISKEDFLSAGTIYYALLNNYKYFDKFYKSHSLPKEFLDEGLKDCGLQLTKKGLEQYRQGNLADAIKIWEGILKFDPANQKIKKAIETTSIQLKNLKKKKIQ